MVQEQSRQELINLKILLQKCFIAEAELASFLLQKTRTCSAVLSADELFNMKHLTDKVERLIDRIEASDEKYHKDASDDNVPLPFMYTPMYTCLRVVFDHEESCH
jgi:hypothetical protein